MYNTDRTCILGIVQTVQRTTQQGDNPMPEHEMPFSGNADCDAFSELDEFTQGYVHAIFFTECHSDNPELENATFADLHPQTLQEIKDDCAGFCIVAREWLDEACDNGRINGYGEERAGTDFWFTRNRHGAGYWDRGLGEAGEKLSEFARLEGSRDLYRGDDGKLYLS
jgi:hypothetical protein